MRTSLILALMTALFVAGCGGEGPRAPAPSPGITEVTFWHTQSAENAEALKKIISDFSRAHPDIKITPQYTGGYTDLFRKMRAAISGGNMPDLAVAYESMVAEYASAGVVIALDEYISDPEHGLPKEKMADIFPGYIATNTFEEFGGKMLSFPFTKSNLMMYFNLDMIRKAGFEDRPKTWDEFLSQCRAIRKMTGRPAYALSVDPSTIDGMIYSFGGELYVREDGKRRTLFDSEASRNTFAVIETLAKEKLAFQINPGTYDDRDALSAERAAFMIRSSTSRPFLEDTIKDRFEWGLSEIPHAEGVKPVTVMFGANICVFRSTPERQLAAWEFIKYFVSPKVTALWATETGYLPVRKTALNEEPYKSFAEAHPRNRAAFDVIPIARPEPNLAGWQEIRKHLDRAETSVITGLKTAAETVVELTEKSNKVLAR